MSIKQYNFFIDDNIRFLSDITRNRYESLFDHFYLNGLKMLHDKYNAKFTLNLFFTDFSDDFTLKDFPDSYFGEWQDNASWLKLSFHAYAETPPRPYAKDGERYKRLAEDYNLIKNEVFRFAPKESFIPPVIVHFFDCDSPDDFEFLKSQGMKVFSVRKYEKEYLEFSKEKDVFLIEPEFFCNNMTVPEIKQKLTQSIGLHRKYLNIGTHEQYFYKDYKRYLPDHFERMETSFKICALNNYQSAFFNEIFQGSLREKLKLDAFAFV